MNLILKLFVFGSRSVELYLQVQQMLGIFGEFSFYVLNDISQLITALHIFNDTWTEDINISKYSH